MRQLRPEDDERLSEESAIVNDNMSAEECDILDRFERDELPSAPGAEREVKEARRAARKTCISTEFVGADILTLGAGDEGVARATDTL